MMKKILFCFLSYGVCFGHTNIVINVHEAGSTVTTPAVPVISVPQQLEAPKKPDFQQLLKDEQLLLDNMHDDVYWLLQKPSAWCWNTRKKFRENQATLYRTKMIPAVLRQDIDAVIAVRKEQEHYYKSLLAHHPDREEMQKENDVRYQKYGERCRWYGATEDMAGMQDILKKFATRDAAATAFFAQIKKMSRDEIEKKNEVSLLQRVLTNKEKEIQKRVAEEKEQLRQAAMALWLHETDGYARRTKLLSKIS